MGQIYCCTNKSRGGGVCVYVNNRWCTSVTSKEQHCCQNIELLFVALRPFYFPQKFHWIFITVVYLPPTANTKIAAEIIHQTMQKQEAVCPDSIRLSWAISTSVTTGQDMDSGCGPRCTDWDAFFDANSTLDEAVDAITSYITENAFFSCIYNPQITVSPTSSFSASFNGNCVKTHP